MCTLPPEGNMTAVEGGDFGDEIRSLFYWPSITYSHYFRPSVLFIRSFSIRFVYLFCKRTSPLLMQPLGPLDLLTEDERVELAQSFSTKLSQAEQQAIILEQQLEVLKDNIRRWQLFLGHPISSVTDAPSYVDGIVPVVSTESSITPTYQKTWTKVDKALYAIQNPQLIGKRTVAGGAEVLAVVLQLEPDLIADKEIGQLQLQFRRLISDLAFQGKVMKLREKKNKNAVHYLHPSWFENGSLKPEYADLLVELEEFPPKKTALANARAEDSTSTGDTVGDDANPDTDEANPPMYKAKKQNQYH